MFPDPDSQSIAETVSTETTDNTELDHLTVGEQYYQSIKQLIKIILESHFLHQQLSQSALQIPSLKTNDQSIVTMFSLSVNHIFSSLVLHCVDTFGTVCTSQQGNHLNLGSAHILLI